MSTSIESGEYYGKQQACDPVLDEERRKRCLCHHCQKLDVRDPASNCPAAAVMFSLCQSVGMAVAVSRCAWFVKKAE
jgi:hypothetical protein